MMRIKTITTQQLLKHQRMVASNLKRESVDMYRVTHNGKVVFDLVNKQLWTMRVRGEERIHLLYELLPILKRSKSGREALIAALKADIRGD